MREKRKKEKGIRREARQGKTEEGERSESSYRWIA